MNKVNFLTPDTSCVTKFTCAKFVTLHNPSLEFVPLGVELISVNRLECVRTCVLRNRECSTVRYSQTSQVCRLGSWPRSTAAPTPHRDTHTQLCNQPLNFELLKNGSVSVCVRVSLDRFNYTSARDVCKGFGGNLYTIKTQEKLNLIVAIATSVNADLWVGLDDMEQEGIFRWVDDGSLLSDGTRRNLSVGGRWISPV
ncbi:C-type mannose receptor 2-like [Physella acuta]|uniref:C-type mannose receptor 2-like n=1 Tax=Physella acuta TaxID=109671 RepID=UPI0027DBAB72|nr:C-type mannose receptor 2-like [Physella acuta]